MSGGSGLTQSLWDKMIAQATAIVDIRKGEHIWTSEIKAHTEYQERPVEWIVERLGVPEATLRWSLNKGYRSHKWDGDKDPIIMLLEALARGEDVGVESATGVGKTYIAACIVLWFLACFEDSIVITAAPKEDQLLLHVWKEIGNLWEPFEKLFPQAELLTGKIRMKPMAAKREKWAATAFVCGIGADEESATKAQGFHGKHMLWITEETPGIHRALMNAITGTRTADHNPHLALGNPNHRQDQLHRFCDLKWVNHIRISAFDHPNMVAGTDVVEGAIGPRRLKERIEEYGKGSRLYLSRIRGISPAEAEDALIRWEWCVAAAERYNDQSFRIGTAALGVDVANSEDGDKGAIARWQGACCTEVEDFQCPDANALGRRVVAEMVDHGIDERQVGIDSVGVGAGTVNECRRLGKKVRQISSATKAVPRLDTDLMWAETYEEGVGSRLRSSGARVVEAERFGSLRDQVWWWAREDLRKGTVAMPHDEELFQDLTTPTFKTDNGIIRVEKKEETVKALKRSPNKGDAFCYGNWVRARRPLSSAHPDHDQELEFESTPNHDYGLERMLARQKKNRDQEERMYEKRLRRWARQQASAR